jgi:ribosome recycling factor
MYQQYIDKITPELEKVLEYFKSEIGKIRTGKASPSLVEDVMIDYEGARSPLKQIASISCPEPRQILIKPWVPAYVQFIEKALMQADLGTNPIVDGQSIRISLPQMTGEFRERLNVQVAKKAEESYQTLRRWRDESLKEMKSGELSEDDKFKGKEELQKVIDNYNKQIEELKDRKKKEILE